MPPVDGFATIELRSSKVTTAPADRGLHVVARCIFASPYNITAGCGARVVKPTVASLRVTSSSSSSLVVVVAGMIGNLKWLGSDCSDLEDSESTQPFKVASRPPFNLLSSHKSEKNMIFYHFSVVCPVGITVLHVNEVAGSNEWPEKGV